VAKAKIEKKAASPTPKRVRRTAEQARELILNAAEKQLLARGPDGLRIQEVAADVGMRHPTVLHHFGSREDLVEAVVNRSLSRLQTDLIATMSGSEKFSGAEMMENVMRVLAEKGHARFIAWLAMSGKEQVDPHHVLRSIAGVLHARRVTDHKQEAPYEDTAFAIMLAAMALLADAIAGPVLRDSAGYADDEDAPRRFRLWLSDLLDRHLTGGSDCS